MLDDEIMKLFVPMKQKLNQLHRRVDLYVTYLCEQLCCRVPLPRDLFHLPPYIIEPLRLLLVHVHGDILVVDLNTQRRRKIRNHRVWHHTRNFLDIRGRDGRRRVRAVGKARGGLEVGDCSAEVTVRGGNERVDRFLCHGYVLGGRDLCESGGGRAWVERLEAEFRATGCKRVNNSAVYISQ